MSSAGASHGDIGVSPVRELPRWLRGALITGVFLGLAALELRGALRKRRREPKFVRNVRNLAIAAAAGTVMRFAERPITFRLAGYVERNQLGLIPKIAGRSATRLFLSILLLDYGLYIWHVLTHKVPLLWRFHLVHHIDLDLDASTALRFHFGEMLLSIPWRLAQIRWIGVCPAALSVWQTFLFASILFHHSNVELPVRLERYLSFFIMTPRLHGIHHEADRKNSSSNWSSGFSIWDLLHGTFKWGDDARTIGVPAYQSVADVTVERCAVIPFERQRNDWSEG